MQNIRSTISDHINGDMIPQVKERTAWFVVITVCLVVFALLSVLLSLKILDCPDEVACQVVRGICLVLLVIIVVPMFLWILLSLAKACLDKGRMEKHSNMVTEMHVI